MTEPSELMTQAEVCELLKLTRAGLYKLRRRGEAPPEISLGPQSIRFRRTDVDRWLNERAAS